MRRFTSAFEPISQRNLLKAQLLRTGNNAAYYLLPPDNGQILTPVQLSIWTVCRILVNSKYGLTIGRDFGHETEYGTYLKANEHK